MSKSKTTKFDAILILGTMRSGSNLLERILIQNPQIVAAGEVFNPNFIGNLAYLGERQNPYFPDISPEARDANPHEFIDDFKSRFAPYIPIARVFPETNERSLMALLHDPKLAKIILKRDPFDSFVSYEISLATNQWLLNRRTKMDPNPSFVFDEVRFNDWLRTNDTFYDAIANALEAQNQHGFELSYDEIKDLDKLNALAEFLGLETGFPRFFEPLERQNTKAKTSYIANPEILNTISRPAWPKPQLSEKIHEPVCTTAYFSPSLKLAYLPLPGTGEHDEIKALKNLSQGDLEPISLVNLREMQSLEPSITSYTTITTPLERASYFLNANLLGAENGFDRLFLDIVNQKLNFDLRERPQVASKSAFKSVGLTPPKYRKLLRDFIIYVRRELWSGHRRHLITDRYWPQSMLIDNLNQSAEFEVLTPAHQGQSSVLQALSKLRQNQHPEPYDVTRLYGDKLDQQLHDLYREDYERFGFSIDLERLNP